LISKCRSPGENTLATGFKPVAFFVFALWRSSRSSLEVQ
jgi:hypothetical protein